MKDYLIIIRYDPKSDTWVVDEDSRHILEDDGKGLTPMELHSEPTPISTMQGELQ